METRQLASSTGQGYTSATYLDAHFESCKAEYEALLRSVEIKRGWHVLDAGSGTGGYVSWLADIVGEMGQVTALDLADDNVAHIQREIEKWDLACPATVVNGSILELPFADNAFDAVWCANTLIYVADGSDGWDRAFAEMSRVVRPGGLVAIKDVDTSLYRLRPSDPVMMPLFYRAGTRLDQNWTGTACFNRTWNLQREMERAGFIDVLQQTTLTERRPPLSDADRVYLRQLLGSFSAILDSRSQELSLDEMASWFGVGRDELRDWLEFWKAMARFDDPDHIFNHPDFYWSEGQVLAVGRVPNQ